MDYFNPVVPEWNEESYQEELLQRQICDYVLYTITPKMVGVYSIAEVVDDSNKRPHKIIFCLLREDGDCRFANDQLKSLDAVVKMLTLNGVKVFYDLQTVATHLNDDLLKVSVDISIDRVLETTDCC